MRSDSRRLITYLVGLPMLALMVSVATLAQTSSTAPPAPKVQPSASTDDKMTITVSPLQLDFGSQLVGSTSAVRTATIIVTTGPDATAKISGTASGDFEVTTKLCDLKGSGSCPFSVTFTPKHLGETTGSVMVLASDNSKTLTKVIALSGKGVARCDEGRSIFTRSGFLSFSPVLIVILLYYAGIVLVRWNLIARPARNLLRSQIEAVKNRVAGLTPAGGTAPPVVVSQVMVLLTKAEEFIQDKKNKNPLAMFPDYFLWNRGQELSGWNCVHAAEEQMTSFLPADNVRVELERSELELRQVSTPTAVGLADRVRDALAAVPSPSLDRLRALLSETLGLLYDRTDTDFATLASWHNKTVWLLGAGLLFIASLSAALQHEVFFLVGATGGLLSRLSRSLHREDVPSDYGASWTTLFLSPVVGALAGWSGVLLLIVASDLNIVGSALKIDWCNPYSPIALGAALLLGTSERAFDTILSQLEEKVKAQPTPPQATQQATLNITTPASLPDVRVGQAYSQSLVASGGTSPYKWTLISGTLPAGLNLDPSGRITGTPGVAATTKFTLQVSDAASKTKSQEFTIVVG